MEFFNLDLGCEVAAKNKKTGIMTSHLQKMRELNKKMAEAEKKAMEQLNKQANGNK